MRTTLLVHIVAGGLGLAFGYVALYAAKGSRLHRASGWAFVSVMLIMALTGMTVAAVKPHAPSFNIPIGLLTSYLVMTALATVRAPIAWSRRLDAVSIVVAIALGLAFFIFGIDALVHASRGNGLFTLPYFAFGIVALLSGVGDLRMMRAGYVERSRRLARHLWRMSFALFIAALTFFLAQTDVFPRRFRIMPLLAAPVLAVLLTMLYWLWRVRVRRTFQAAVDARPEVETRLPASGERMPAGH